MPYAHLNFNQQLIDRPARTTKKSKTLIDLVFMNRMERITKTLNLITDRSDHNLMLAVRKLTKKQLVHHTENGTKSVKSGIPKCKTADFERELMQMNWDTVTETHDLNTCYHNFMTGIGLINGLIDRYT